jgi:formylglycine-generating enzyme required for sulfatase activity
VLSGTVAVTGTAEAGQNLTADTGSLGGTGAISYQWLRGDDEISGASAASYTLTTDDVGQTIKVRVRRAGYTGTATSGATGTVIFLAMHHVPAGSFQRDDTATNITIITKGYRMGETEVTQGLFEAVMGARPSSFTTNPEDGAADGWRKLPVERVNWYAAIAFCNKLSIKDGKAPVYSVKVGGVEIGWASLTSGAIPGSRNGDWDAAEQDLSKNGYRLPTEMEWMWAAMGADKTAQPNTSGYGKAFAGNTGSIDDNAWHSGNSAGKTHQTGYKNANELGLKDMSGNVREWCWDWWSSSYGSEEKIDFTGNVPGILGSARRVVRGGSWSGYASYCAVAGRRDDSPDYAYYLIGFRVVSP